jgi:hypothetical protein
MEKLQFPWFFVGPPGAGKTSTARKMLADSLGLSEEDVYPKDIRMFKVGDDNECRVYCSPYHFEIDIPDMSMQDKQILVEVLSMLFSAGDVFSGMKTNKRKLVILRRAHSLSLAAAVRLRWILETRVCTDGGTGMIWLCAREVTGSLSVVEDLFVKYRVPGPTKEQWLTHWVDTPFIADNYELLDGRMDRAAHIVRWGASCIEQKQIPRVIADCYEDLVVEIIRGSFKAAAADIKDPPLALVTWVRDRVYDLLGLCQTGIEFLDGYSNALETCFLKKYYSYNMFRAAIEVVAIAEPNTSYRNPVSLEKILLDICEQIWNWASKESKESIAEYLSHLPVEPVKNVTAEGDLESPENGVVEPKKSKSTAAAKKSNTDGTAKPKKRGTGGEGEGATKVIKPTKSRSTKK